MIIWHTEKRNIADLKNWDKNARTISKQKYDKLKERIKLRGMHDVLKIDENNIVLSGNQRLRALKELGFSEVEVMVSDKVLTEEEKDAVGLESNMNDGEWDWEVLANNYNEEDLEKLGFSEKELGKMEEAEANAQEAEIDFSEELLLEHNYIVLYFDNALDWQVAVDKFGLKQVKDLIPRKGQPTGIGRVLEGKKWINRIQ